MASGVQILVELPESWYPRMPIATLCNLEASESDSRYRFVEPDSVLLRYRQTTAQGIDRARRICFAECKTIGAQR